jgi:DNA-binding GntR family transcriptional regulator
MMSRPVPDLIVNKSTLSENVYHALLQAILDHVIHSGEKLITEHLSERMGVSRTPVIEALGRLRQEGLLVYSERQGHRIVELGLSSIPDLFDARMICEVYSATRWQTEPSGQTPSNLQDAVSQMETLAAQPSTAQQWYRLELAFHRQLAALSRNYLVSSWHERSIVLINMVWIPVPIAETPNINAPSLAEHREILAAMQRRDLPAVEAAIRKHTAAEMQRLASHIKDLEA